MSELDRLLANIEQTETSSEKRRLWNPQQVGHIDIRISVDGSWFHEGRRFQKKPLVKLFASVLHREGDEYFLLTPVEKLKIQVEDAPFLASLVESITENNQQAIVFTTNLGDKFLLDEYHPIRVDIDQQTQMPRPYVHYRDNLDALISRSAFFELINLAEERQRDGKVYLTICSLGHEFELGCVDPMENT